MLPGGAPLVKPSARNGLKKKKNMHTNSISSLNAWKRTSTTDYLINITLVLIVSKDLKMCKKYFHQTFRG